MASLRDVFAQVNRLREEGTILEYAVGGASAILFHAEPVTTYDLDLFVFLPTTSGAIVSMAPLYDRLRSLGLHPSAEHVMIAGVPGGPAGDSRAPRFGGTMDEIRRDGISAGRPSEELMESLFEAKRRWHEEQARLPIRENFRILLEMQRLHHPLIARRRPLEPWEQPWETEP